MLHWSQVVIIAFMSAVAGFVAAAILSMARDEKPLYKGCEKSEGD